MEDANRNEAAEMKVLIMLKSVLFSETLCGELAHGADEFEAQAYAHGAQDESFRPDVILADRDSLRNLEQQDPPGGKVLLIDTGITEEEIFHLMLNHKLYGVFSLGEGLGQLKKAIAVVQRGQIWIDSDRLKSILHGIETIKNANSHEKLSTKETQIVELVAEGYKNREIAERLLLSEQTVKSHLGRIFRKMHVSNRSQLVSAIMRNKVSLTEQNQGNLFPE